MNNELLVTLIFAAIAVGVILKLRSVLGRNIGHQEPPEHLTRHQDRQDREVTDRPDRTGEAVEAPRPSRSPVADVPVTTPLGAGLAAIAQADRSFDPDAFADGARQAFRSIVAAYADGDRETLKMLLGKKVYDSFDASIAERETQGEVLTSTILSLDAADVIEAEMAGKEARVTVRFRSTQSHKLVDREGKVLDDDGSAADDDDIIDIWTFARDTRSSDPNWLLVETESLDD